MPSVGEPIWHLEVFYENALYKFTFDIDKFTFDNTNPIPNPNPSPGRLSEFRTIEPLDRRAVTCHSHVCPVPQYC